MSVGVSQKRSFVTKSRVHDYLYDTAFIVSGARDYARTAFRAAMASSERIIQPVYKNMFTDLRTHRRIQVVYHTNCRLPKHVDSSWGGYLQRAQDPELPVAQLVGSKRFKFQQVPKKVLPLKTHEPQFNPPTPIQESIVFKSVNKKCQTIYRESSAQTRPWQPDAKAADSCEEKPEVLYLDKLQWGPGSPYRNGDLPADFHTTEIINKMRHARQWMALVENNRLEGWMKKRNDVITDIETKDWIFREAEIDELQEIRLELLHRLQEEDRREQATRTQFKLGRRWERSKAHMQHKITSIHRARDRELRKLTLQYEQSSLEGKVAASRAARGFGPITYEVHDPTSDIYAPLARHGYQAKNRHTDIIYDPGLLVHEDHNAVAQPPEWLERCGQDLTRTCSGQFLPRDATQLCERWTKWSDHFLENLHHHLKQARLGAEHSAARPLHVLRPRRPAQTPRPATPQVCPVRDDEELCYQHALFLQRLIRGRAVHTLMYEGRTRFAELTEELKTTHGLQKEDKVRIAKEEAHATNYDIKRNIVEQKENAITALVDELCGGAVSAALDFLEKELRRLKEERKQHAYILIAIREKTMREAAEAGRRQKEEQRRKEHDEMFKRVLGMTQETVDVYLEQIVSEGVRLSAELDARQQVAAHAVAIEREVRATRDISTAEENELVAELVNQFLLPEAHKAAARQRISTAQKERLEFARKTIFGLLDDAEIKTPRCKFCGSEVDDSCRCRHCPYDAREPVETIHRQDPRWKHTTSRPRPAEKTWEERYPSYHEFRCMLNALIDDVVTQSKVERIVLADRTREENMRQYEIAKVQSDANEIVDYCGPGMTWEWPKCYLFHSKYRARERHCEKKDQRDRDRHTHTLRRSPRIAGPGRRLDNKNHEVFNVATGAITLPVMEYDYRHTMRRVIVDAMARTETPPTDQQKGRVLPSEIRMQALEKDDLARPWCKCDEKKKLILVTHDMLPSDLRSLEELRRCKCDQDSKDDSPTRRGMKAPSPSPMSSRHSELESRPETSPGDFTAETTDDTD